MRAPWRSSWTPIGIEVSGRYINAVQMRGGARPQIEACVMIRRPDPEVPVEPAEIAMLTGILERKGFRGRTVVAAMPPDQVMADVLDVPVRKDARQTDRVVRAELAKRHQWAERGFELASWELPQSGHQDQRHRVMAVACPHQSSGPFLDAFEQAGLHVRALDLQSWALARLCVPSLADMQGLCGVVSLGWSSANLIVLNRETVVYVRTLNNVSLNRLHLNLCTRLGLEAEVSEHVVRQSGMGAPSREESARLQAVNRQLAAFAGQLVAELRRSLSYIVQEFPDTPVDRLRLVGEGASIRGLDEVLSEGLGVRAEPLLPTDLVDCAPSVLEQCREPMLSTAVGLATW